jgi:hypothetical protein
VSIFCCVWLRRKESGCSAVLRQRKIGLYQYLVSAEVRKEEITLRMKKVISSIEVVDESGIKEGRVEVCASADATFDEDRGQLTVTLDSFVRPIDFKATQKHWRPDWLPSPEIVKENLALEEAMPATKEIFRRWTPKIRQSIPATVNN